MESNFIRVRGCRVHNLKNIDIDIQRGRLIVVCGLSGSGKTSLALDTLYAEGQRRYIESFSAYTRQFLQRLDKPDVDSVEGIPPAIAVLRGTTSRGNRSTVATATEIAAIVLRVRRASTRVSTVDPASVVRIHLQSYVHRVPIIRRICAATVFPYRRCIASPGIAGRMVVRRTGEFGLEIVTPFWKVTVVDHMTAKEKSVRVVVRGRRRRKPHATRT